MLQLYTYVIDITSKPLFFVHFVDDVDLNVTFQVFLFSLVGLKCCGFLFFFFWFALCQVRKQNCKIKNSLNHFLSHLFLSLLANIFACNPLSSRKTTLYSEVEVVLVRSFLTQTLSHWVTLSFLYSFFCKCRFSLSARLWAYSQSGNKKKSQTEWKDEIRVVAATLRHSPPTFISPRMLRGPKSSRLTLHTNTSVEGKSAFAATRRAVGS